MSLLGKPLFEMCWYYVGIAQVALDPSPPLSNGQTWKRSAPAILASPPLHHQENVPIYSISIKGCPSAAF